VHDVRGALQRRRALAAGQQQLGQRGGVDVPAGRGAARVQQGARRAGEDSAEPRAVVVAAETGSRVPLVGRGEHHARERDSVGHRVVDPRQHRCAVAEPIDEVHLPERSAMVERRGSEVAHQRAQRR
jgi:hypothetical protein